MAERQFAARLIQAGVTPPRPKAIIPQFFNIAGRSWRFQPATRDWLPVEGYASARRFASMRAIARPCDDCTS